MSTNRKKVQAYLEPEDYDKLEKIKIPDIPDRYKESMSSKAVFIILKYLGSQSSDSQVNPNELQVTEVENLKEEFRALKENLPEQITTLVTEQITPIAQEVENLKNNESERKLQSESNQLPQLPTVTTVTPPASSDLPVNQDDSLTSSQEYPSVDESNLPMTVEDAPEIASSDTKAIESSNTPVEIDSQVVTVTLQNWFAKHVQELKKCKTKDELESFGSRYPDELKKIVWSCLPEEEKKSLWIMKNNPFTVEQIAELFLISPTRVNQVAREGHKTFREWSSWFRKGTWDFIEIETSNKINRKQRLFHKIN